MDLIRPALYREENVLLYFFFECIILLRIINIHSGTLNDAVKIICLVELNM